MPEHRLRELRLERQMTLEHLAARIGVSVPYLSNLERGNKRLNEDVLERAAAALKVKPWHILADARTAEFANEMDQMSSDDRRLVENFIKTLRASHPSDDPDQG